ncbi:GNAT family N-acetyltransferase [Agromyces sp. GXQ0307]|uniref:GNAT family N-acetyltransferase n=1 Tax=Agromyces sp. GXQ0307 TaxID=3377835 RepID=UPI00383B2F8D
MSAPGIEIVQFDRSYDRSAFSCGKEELDDWLRRYAGQSERNNTTRTFLAVEGERIVGYYATRTLQLDLDQAASAFGMGKRRYPVPAILLARLAAAITEQGKGVGKMLLVDALRRMVEVSNSVGYEVIVVDAIDHEASTFYRRYGFQPFEDDALHLFMTTRSLRATFAAVD